MRRAASVTLSSTVRCGNRLNCWKTIPILCRTAETSVPRPRDLLTLEEDPARVERLEQVDAAQERALSASARADHDEHLARRDVQVDPVEHEVVAEALPNRLEPNHLVRPTRARRRRGALCHRPSLHGSNEFALLARPDRRSTRARLVSSSGRRSSRVPRARSSARVVPFLVRLIRPSPREASRGATAQ